MFKFIPFSDTHGYVEKIKDIPEQKDVTALLCGDIHEVKKLNKYKEIISLFSSKFKNVIVICGNHEYYTRCIHKVHWDIEALVKEFDNVHFLNNDIIYLDGVYIIGSTLWVDFNKGNPLDKMYSRELMNDYKYIRHGPESFPYQRKLSTEDIEMFHSVAKDFIFDSTKTILQKDPNAKILVMTHHAPSTSSTPERYINSKENYSFVSDLSSEILNTNIKYWLHGHIHQPVNYQIGTCNVLSNPMGHGFENPNFNTTKYYVL